MKKHPKLLVTKKTGLPIYVTRSGIGTNPACCHCTFNGGLAGIDPHGGFDCPHIVQRAFVYGICKDFEPEDGTQMLLWDTETKTAREYTHGLEHKENA